MSEANGSIGVLIPAFDAAASVAGVVESTRRYASRVIVVDDGSTDATAREAFAGGAADDIKHPENRGKGAALKTGFSRFRDMAVEAVITLDADGQHDPRDIPTFVAAFRDREADLIIGSRRRVFDRMSEGRHFGNRFSCGALEFFTGLEIPDSQSGFRLYAGPFLRNLNLRRNGYDAEMEVLLYAVKSRCRIESIPVSASRVDGKSTSHYRPWVDTYKMCRTVVLYCVCEL